ncbi:hypothetical protein DRW03_15890 [Corallococcus sp. H22C18031201]|uniref:DUF5320 domain-containing protein n=1 Tax=Citreicoccus inhibens TaxID=2849499 RepID=UPI000E71336F|nr:DUF5320 domain-containing protein [Citreicoccus inhibens]MBU8899847.1 DUF5320 domain-containing protein [Citreicoccus inhibens]RJS21818.1 hypothetical protein DRW03_15890 [Corallococcus sp. H22C18031201]
MRARAVGIAVLMLIAGCAPTASQLRPAPSAQVVQGDTAAATTQQEGVHLVADGTAWKGHPSDLGQRLTPVFVQVQNQSDRPLRIQYSAFSLVGADSHFHYSALPLLALQNGLAQGTGGSGNNNDNRYAPASWSVGLGYGFGYGPGWRRGFGWGPYWGGPWFDPYYYPGYYGAPYPEPLPTEDMLTRALPEGTLAPGGRLDGFLYFQGVTRRESAVKLELKLVDARTGEAFGTLDIPFQVSKG